ncbi:MAG: hypothetical protein GF353_00115 [Candidatus Lokiarchaeota archaeon]|nr:hypothetical protein [Candidatus Lokiarchaeota archaeon]
MAWELVTRDDRFEGSDRPFVSIAKAHIAFNAMFTRIAEIDSSYRVSIYADPDNLRLGFEFHTDDRPNSLSLSQASSEKKGKKGKGLFCSAFGIVSKYPWVDSVTKLRSKDRRFYNPKKEGKLWAIQLCPAFENRKARESKDIPSDANGIYRYLRENGEIVYIGRGGIAKRLSSPERKDWDFDDIEYSVLKDPDQQVKWETYWIEKFKEQNSGKLPFYNKVSGIDLEK